jgi:hypothetical protein
MLKLELIEWDDHSSGSTNNWEPLAKMSNPARIPRAKSVGWNVYEDKKIVILCPHLCENDGCGEMLILKSAITKRRKL